ncbi:hypothetical protein niasHT_011896 [Heterodera trifolii]|uniref:Uncharacterized protein n=1 Tax=Heterodera trifolii TaxID=157864 RepID=A0ABD2KW63_9BILA
MHLAKGQQTPTKNGKELDHSPEGKERVISANSDEAFIHSPKVQRLAAALIIGQILKTEHFEQWEYQQQQQLIGVDQSFAATNASNV